MTTDGQLQLMLRLRQETRELHASVEKCVDVLRPDLEMAHYRDVLARFYGFYRPYEIALDRIDRIGLICPDYTKRKKTVLLEADLQELGLTSAFIESLPVCRDLPPLITAAEALGSLYVTEGATLGGAIIERHVRQRLGMTSGPGFAFFASYGDERGAMWRRLGDAINSVVIEADVDRVLKSAARTFEAFERWLKNDLEHSIGR
jgi:heme oxygenase (biliverdin-IX-beta and delta-forming)